MAETIELSVNGASESVQTDPERSLLSVLRDDLGLTGAKYGCGEGQCGACTVLVDGQAKRSCITPVGECAGKPIGTIEGLAPEGELHPLQAAFLECDAMQCGYCTTGMVMTASALLQRTPEPSPQDILRAMNGNICRCGTYARITAAIQAATQTGKGGGQ
jgi:nicotinate dehydrogenase subunit A